MKGNTCPHVSHAKYEGQLLRKHVVCGGYVDDAAKAAPGSGMWITPLRGYPPTPALRPHITRRSLAALTRT